MKRKICILFGSLVLVLTGCIPSIERNEEDIIIVEETDEVEEQQYVITPTIDTPENYYRNVLTDGTYNRSQARGNVAHAMNNRIDINQFELGLMEIATANFDQEQYYFQEGEFLDGELINSWLRRYNPFESRNRNGLNPPLIDIGDLEELTEEEYKEAEEAYELAIEELDDNALVQQMRDKPNVLSHIMEHNYLYESEDNVNLGGVVIGLSLNSVYYFRTDVVGDDGVVRYNFHEETLDPEEVERRGKEIAQEVVSRLRSRENLESVPITVALYQEERRGAIVPGSFTAITHLDEGQTTIQGWEAVNEEFYFFPSRSARNAFPAQSSAFSEFQVAVEEFFDRPVGIVGKGRYKNEQLEEISIEFNLQSHGKAEIIALTQFISGRIGTIFSSQAPTYVYINSINGPEALIIQYPDHDPYIHIYKN